MAKKIASVASQTGYPEEAVDFVLKGWLSIEVENSTHVDSQTLCWRFHDYALHLYGDNARTQLKSWGITTTLDFGQIVFGMVEQDMIRASKDETVDEFKDVFQFDKEFSKIKNPDRVIPTQWNLSTLFVVTTLSAIAISGLSRRGLDGIMYALMSSWLGFMGVACIIIGVRSRSPGWIFLISIGMVFAFAGLFLFFTFSL